MDPGLETGRDPTMGKDKEKKKKKKKHDKDENVPFDYEGYKKIWKAFAPDLFKHWEAALDRRPSACCWRWLPIWRSRGARS